MTTRESVRDRNLDVLGALATLGVVATHARYLARPRIDGVFITTLWQGGRLTVLLFFADAQGRLRTALLLTPKQS